VSGVLFGVSAALILGVNTILIALAARWWGVWRTTASALIIAFAGILAFAAVTGQSIPLDAGGWVVLLMILGFAAGASYFASHQGLRLGPVSVVSPIGSTTGAMTVVLAFLILGERPNVIQWVGIPLATVGVVLLSLEFKKGGRARLIGWGPLFAVLGVLTGAVSNAVLRLPVREIGVIPTIVGQRTFTVAFILIAWPFVIRANRVRARSLQPAGPGPIGVPAVPPTPEPTRLSVRAWGLLLAVGVLDAAAFLSFAQGLVLAPAWLIGLLSQSGRMIAIVGGYMLFKERLLGTQWLGLLLTIGGLVLAVAG
jgi:drug/metabolite transporter (DMT)-like permease